MYDVLVLLTAIDSDMFVKHSYYIVFYDAGNTYWNLFRN